MISRARHPAAALVRSSSTPLGIRPLRPDAGLGAEIGNCEALPRRDASLSKSSTTGLPLGLTAVAIFGTPWRMVTPNEEKFNDYKKAEKESPRTPCGDEIRDSEKSGHRTRAPRGGLRTPQGDGSARHHCRHRAGPSQHAGHLLFGQGTWNVRHPFIMSTQRQSISPLSFLRSCQRTDLASSARVAFGRMPSIDRWQPQGPRRRQELRRPARPP